MSNERTNGQRRTTACSDFIYCNQMDGVGDEQHVLKTVDHTGVFVSDSRSEECVYALAFKTDTKPQGINKAYTRNHLKTVLSCDVEHHQWKHFVCTTAAER